MQKLEIFQVSSFAACQTGLGLLQETTNSDVSSFSRTSGNPIPCCSSAVFAVDGNNLKMFKNMKVLKNSLFQPGHTKTPDRR